MLLRLKYKKIHNEALSPKNRKRDNCFVRKYFFSTNGNSLSKNINSFIESVNTNVHYKKQAKIFMY